jgi:DNA-directed RNA polymerase subunit L
MLKIKNKTDEILTIQFSKETDYSVINAIRRTCLSDIITPAFVPENININKNTSILNNDFIRQRISMIPIKKSIVEKINKEDKFEMTLEETNNTTNNISITTDNCVFFLNEKILNKKYGDPILICNLKPTQEINLKSIATSGFANQHNCWSAVSTSYYDDDNNLTIESLGQYDSLDIFKKSCTLITEKLEKLKQIILKYYQKRSDKDKFEITIENEDHTLGNLFASYIQLNHSDIYSAYNKPHPSESKIQILVMNDKLSSKNIKELCLNTIDKLNQTFLKYIKNV